MNRQCPTCDKEMVVIEMSTKYSKEPYMYCVVLKCFGCRQQITHTPQQIEPEDEWKRINS